MIRLPLRRMLEHPYEAALPSNGLLSLLRPLPSSGAVEVRQLRPDRRALFR